MKNEGNPQRTVFNKRNPGADGTFTALPSDAFHYVHHPKVTPDMLFLYALIIDYYNVDEGFAFPAEETLSIDYGRATNTVSKHLEILREVGLIDFPEKGHYIPLKPLSAAEFYEQFPEAWAQYTAKRDSVNERKDKARIRAQEWRERNGYNAE